MMRQTRITKISTLGQQTYVNTNSNNRCQKERKNSKQNLNDLNLVVKFLF